MNTNVEKSLPKCKMFIRCNCHCVLYLCGTRVEAVPGDYFTLSPRDSENPFVFGIEVESASNIGL